jgi:hypothetical protein
MVPIDPVRMRFTDAGPRAAAKTPCPIVIEA